MNLDPGAGTKDLVANLPAVPEGSRVFSAHRFGADGKGVSSVCDPARRTSTLHSDNPELCKRVLNSSRSVFVWSSKLADTLSRRKCTRENGQMGATGSLGNVSESSRGAGRPPAPTERCCADAGASLIRVFRVAAAQRRRA
jgi:hypothetical protein